MFAEGNIFSCVIYSLFFRNNTDTYEFKFLYQQFVSPH